MKTIKFLLITSSIFFSHLGIAQKICKGTGYDIKFTWRDLELCKGTGHDVLITIRDSKVCKGTGYSVLYTIRDSKVCKGTGYDVLYTIRDGYLDRAKLATTIHALNYIY